MTNGQIVSISELDQIINDVNNYTQYEHPSDPQLIGYVEEEQVRGMTGQQWDVVIADGEELENFKLDIEVKETQRIEKILAKFTTLDSMPNMAFVIAEEFNAILNFCSNMFELRLSYDGNGPVQATVKEVVLLVEYPDFADIFSPTLVHKLPFHALHDHAIKIGDSQHPFGPIYLLSAVELDVLKKFIEDNLEKDFIVSFMSLTGALILFTKKKDGGLRLCVDYWGLNALTRKNKHPLPFINEILD